MEGEYWESDAPLSKAKAVKTTEYRTPRVCNISPEARKICDGLNMSPSDAIVWLDGIVHKTFSPDEFRKIVNESVRQVTQVEGVMLHDKQKGFFRELFANLMQVFQKRGA